MLCVRPRSGPDLAQVRVSIREEHVAQVLVSSRLVHHHLSRRLFKSVLYICVGDVGSCGGGRERPCFSNMEENNGEGDTERRPPVKVISKWKTPSKIINRVTVK